MVETMVDGLVVLMEYNLAAQLAAWLEFQLADRWVAMLVDWKVYSKALRKAEWMVVKLE
jgi:hypothetical protein